MIPLVSECKVTDLVVMPSYALDSHIAFGSIRMEPVFMILGQRAALAAALAIDSDIDVQKVPYEQSEIEVHEEKQILATKTE